MATHRERIRQTHERGESEVEFARVLAFTDGVFAIAITLLVLALEVPADVDDVGAALRDRSSDFVAYGFSFAVLGSIWLAHHRFYGSVIRFNTRLIVLNLVYLALVALVPFSAELLGHYSDTTAGVTSTRSTSPGSASRSRHRSSTPSATTWSRRTCASTSDDSSARRRSSSAGRSCSRSRSPSSIPSICPFIWIGLLVFGGRISDAIGGRSGL